MYKKMIAIFLSCVMLVSISPAVAAEDAPAKPTIEEILSEYHQKAFDAQISGEVHTAAANSRQSGSDSKTLEEETVDTLNAAGYEAYNITADNYEALQATLKTDFASMGLDPNGSYIIVISGEGDSSSNNPNSRLGNLPVYDFIDDGGSSNLIYYTYEGVEYTLRRIYLTSTDQSDLYVKTKFEFSEIRNISDYATDILSTVFSIGIDHVAGKFVPGLPLASIMDLMFDWATNDALTVYDPEDITVTDPEDITMHAATRWTRDYLQVKNTAGDYWYTSHYVSSAESKARCIGGYIYDPQTDSPIFIEGNEQVYTTYSPYYHDLNARKALAVQAFLGNYISYCCTGDIPFYFVSETGAVNFNSGTDPLFIHEETSVDYIPIYDYD